MNRRDALLAAAALGWMGISGRSLARSSDGFFVPPEESPHQQTLMQWPVNRRIHPNAAFLDRAQQTIADIANVIAEFEPVSMLVPEDELSAARAQFGASIDLYVCLWWSC